MRNFERRKIKIALLIILLLALIPVFAFLLRSPVLIVTDESFNRLYGPARLAHERRRVSRELFRRIIPVMVAETAGDDLVSIAVEGASNSPILVLFPYRYFPGARNYKNKYPERPVLVVGGSRPRNESVVPFVRINIEEDLYRAGLCAAAFAGEQRIVFFGDGSASGNNWDAFRQGLRDRDYMGSPLFPGLSSEYSSFSDVGCVILTGAASKFIEKKLKMPMILFSWLDPAMTPRSVKLVFDDSPWALAADIFRNFDNSGRDIEVSSRPLVLEDRFDEKKDFRNIQHLVKEKLQKN